MGLGVKDDGALAGFLMVVAIIVILLSIFAFCGFVAAEHEYSTGYRDGEVIKFSHKGVIWKTYEGQLGSIDRGHTPPWEFSVLDPSITDELNKLEPGTKVRLHYKEVWFHWFWTSSTSYRITRVEHLKLVP